MPAVHPGRNKSALPVTITPDSLAWIVPRDRTRPLHWQPATSVASDHASVMPGSTFQTTLKLYVKRACTFPGLERRVQRALSCVDRPPCTRVAVGERTLSFHLASRKIRSAMHKGVCLATSARSKLGVCASALARSVRGTLQGVCEGRLRTQKIWACSEFSTHLPSGARRLAFVACRLQHAAAAQHP